MRIFYNKFMTDIIAETEDFVFELFKENLPYTFLYHNFTHTKRVLRSLNEILENSNVSPQDTLILRLAALLHDTGYIKNRENHEDESVKIATNFLKKQNLELPIIEAVNQCIIATKFKNTPKTELEKTIRDADASHFGKEYFNEASELL